MTTAIDNLQKRKENVRRIVMKNYEPGNQRKCKLQVFRNIIKEIYPMSERTFWRYMSINANDNK